MQQEYVSPKEAADLLAVDRLTIYKMLEAGELPAIRVRRAIRILRSALDKLPPYRESAKEES